MAQAPWSGRKCGTVLGQKREYLTIQIAHNDMIVNVPTENAERVGLRKVIDEVMVERVIEVLHGSGTTMPKNWNRRFKYNRDKMKTGDIFELAEVVRNLSLREQEKGLSTGEKQMFVKAKKILASELMYAKDMDEDETAEWLDEMLAARQRQGCGRLGTPAGPRGAPDGRIDAAPRSRTLARERRLGGARRGRAGASGSARDRPKAFAPLGGQAAARREPRASGRVRADRRASSSSRRRSGRSRRSCSPRSSAPGRSSPA